MEVNDIIQISAEGGGDDDDDDSLLNGDVSTSNIDFSCSPLLLHLPRSKPPLPPPLSSPLDGNVDKENDNVGRPEVAKLSVDRQKMKKKKKGYNLRKSLAWNRAFFTEEGVLDPVELSILSGSLSVINEEGESLSSGLDALEESRFKELPSSSVSSYPRAGSSVKEKMGSASKAKRKVLSTYDINRSASKRSGIPPRPMASSFLKKPPNVNTPKVAAKDPKLTELATTKSVQSVVSATTRSSKPIANPSRHNQTVQPVIAKKNVGSKVTSTSTKSAVNAVRSGPVVKSVPKSTIQQARRNMVKVNSAPDLHPSTNVSHVPVTQANSGIQSDPVHSAASDQSNSDSRIPASVPFSSCYSGNMQYTQPQAVKPSGLRMPSPSLCLFGQSKATISHSLLPRSTQPSKLPEPVGHFSKLGGINRKARSPPRPSGKLPAPLNAGGPAVSTVNPISLAKHKSNNMQNVQMQVLQDLQTYEKIEYQQQLQVVRDVVDQQSLDMAQPAEPCELEKRVTEMWKRDNNLGLQGMLYQELKKDDEHERVTSCRLNSRDMTGAGLDHPNFTSHISQPVEVEGLSDIKGPSCDEILHDKQAIDVKNCSDVGILEVHEDQSSMIHDVNEQSGEPAMLCAFRKSSCCVDISKHESLDAVEVNPDEFVCQASKSEVSSNLCNSDDTEQRRGSASGITNLSRASQVPDADVQCKDGNLIIDNDGKDVLSNSVPANSHLMIIDGVSRNCAENDEHPYPSVVVEPKNICLEDFPEESVHRIIKPVMLTDPLKVELECKNVLCSLPPFGQGCGLEADKNLECLMVENVQKASVYVDQANDISTHIQLQDEVAPLELETMEESHKICAVTSCDSPVLNVYRNSGDFVLSGSENYPTSSPSCPFPQVKDASQDCTMTLLEQEGEVDKPCLSLLPPNLQAGNDTTQNGILIPTLHSDGSVGVMDNGNPPSAVQANDISTHGLQLQGEVTPFDVETMKESHKICALTSCDSPVSDVYRNSGDFRSNGSENHPISSSSCPLPQVKDASQESMTSLEQEGDVHKPCLSLLPPNLQAGNDSTQSGISIPTLHSDGSVSAMDNGNPPSAAPANLINSSSGDAKQENQAQEPGHVLLFHERRCSEESWVVNIGNIVDTDAAGANGSHVPCGLCQHEITEEANELSVVSDMIEEIPAEDVQVQSMDGSLLAGNCSIGIDISVENKNYSMIADYTNEQPETHPVIQNPDHVPEHVYLENDRLCSDSDSSMDISSDDGHEGEYPRCTLNDVTEECHSQFSETEISNVGTEHKSAQQEVDLDKKAKLASIEDAALISAEIDSYLKNVKCSLDFKHVNDETHNIQAPLEFDSSPKKRRIQIPLTGNNFVEKASGTSRGNPQGIEANPSKDNILSEEAESCIIQDSASQSEMQCELDNVTEDKDGTLSLNKSENKEKINPPILQPPLNAVPFSDEWLAALEAAGEEILTMKSGAVQNSPPDKLLPEPSPWSPVKRKNNQGIGPFDCTKFTNNSNPPSTSS